MSATTESSRILLGGRPRPRWRDTYGIRLLFQAGSRHRLLRTTFAMALALYLIHAAQQLIGLPHSDLRWDWAQFYNAGAALRAGADPYAAYLQACPAYHWCVGGYIYPPLFAQLLEPLTRLPLLASAYIWLLCDHLLLLGSAVVAYRALRAHVSRDGLLLVGIVALLFSPLYQTLFFLQVTPLLVLLLAVSAAAFMRGTRRGLILAGAAIGAAAVLRLTPVVVLPALVLVGPGIGAARPWFRKLQVGGAMGAAAAGALLVGLMLLTTRYTVSYFIDVLPRIGAGTAHLDNISIPGLVDRAAIMAGWIPPSATLLEIICLVVGVTVTWFIAIRARGRADSVSTRAVTFAAFLSALPLVSSITWHHHLVTELLVVALLAPAIQLGWADRRVRQATLLLGLGYVLMWFDRYQLDPLSIALGLRDPHGLGIPALLLVQSVPIAGQLLAWMASLLLLLSVHNPGVSPSDEPRGVRYPPIVFKLMEGPHVFWYRLTKGLVGHRIGHLKMLLLDHVGRKSGKRYTTPLLYGIDGKNLLVVASKGGFPKDPAWYGNLMANPDVEVQVGSRRREVRARMASAEEKKRLWDIMLKEWPTYDTYQRNTDREIPVVVLEPR